MHLIKSQYDALPGRRLIWEDDPTCERLMAHARCVHDGKIYGAQHLDTAPNILRSDMSEEEHIKIIEVFYNYLIKKKYI